MRHSNKKTSGLIKVQNRMLLGEITELSMSTKRSRVRRHSISSLEEAAKKAAQEPTDSKTAMGITVNAAEMLATSGSSNARKRPLPLDASHTNDVSQAKRLALLTGGLSMEDLLKNAAVAPTHALGGDPQYLCLPGGTDTLVSS